MNVPSRTLASFALAAALAAPALGDPSNVSPSRKFCWGENIGFLNWRDAGSPPASQGAVIGMRFMSGFVWGENVGWINLGDGTPGLATGQYGNTDGSDTGVNIAQNGDLFGLAWGENIGWINFDTRAALAPFGQQARLDRAAQRLRGYAWGENVGWINLDDSAKFVSTACPGDVNADGQVNIDDIFVYLNAWFSSCAGDAAPPCSGINADFDGVGGITITDIFVFLNAWFAGC